MSIPLLSSAPRRLVSALMATMFGLTLALNPMSALTASASVSPSAGYSALGVAASEIGVPYKWGGTSPRTGFDCSGLTQYVYARIGRRIPRTAEEQYVDTIRIPWKARRPGDLVFFFSRGIVYHVGVYAGNWWTMIAAPHTGARVMRESIWSMNVKFGRVR